MSNHQQQEPIPPVSTDTQQSEHEPNLDTRELRRQTLLALIRKLTCEDAS